MAPWTEPACSAGEWGLLPGCATDLLGDHRQVTSLCLSFFMVQGWSLPGPDNTNKQSFVPFPWTRHRIWVPLKCSQLRYRKGYLVNSSQPCCPTHDEVHIQQTLKGISGDEMEFFKFEYGQDTGAQPSKTLTGFLQTRSSMDFILHLKDGIFS